MTRESEPKFWHLFICHTPRPLCMVSRWMNTDMTNAHTDNPAKEYTTPRCRISDNGSRAIVGSVLNCLSQNHTSVTFIWMDLATLLASRLPQGPRLPFIPIVNRTLVVASTSEKLSNLLSTQPCLDTIYMFVVIDAWTCQSDSYLAWMVLKQTSSYLVRSAAIRWRKRRHYWGLLQE